MPVPASGGRPLSDDERIDAMLYERYAAGDLHAREELVARLMPMVQRLARS